MTRRTGIIATAITATSVIATALIVTLTGGGGTDPHVDTRMDASDNVVPPYDFRRGYERTGTVCQTRDATRSRCFEADDIPYTLDATDVGWVTEPAQNNRIPYNVSATCDGTPFTCVTATMTSDATGPDGNATASAITMGGGHAELTAFGYGNSAALDLRMWVKCSSGTLDASNILVAGGIGSWQVNCTTVGGVWALLHSAHAAVTESESWVSDGSGGVQMRFTGADAEIWQITATEVASTWHHNTIPTSDATGSSIGLPVWDIDNSTGVFWAASGVTKTETRSEYAGDCWVVSGSTIKLNGFAGCTSTLYVLNLVWSY